MERGPQRALGRNIPKEILSYQLLAMLVKWAREAELFPRLDTEMGWGPPYQEVTADFSSPVCPPGKCIPPAPASLPYSDCSTGCLLTLACTLQAPPTSLLRDRTQRSCPHSVLLLSSEYFHVGLSGTPCISELVLRSCAVTQRAALAAARWAVGLRT